VKPPFPTQQQINTKLGVGLGAANSSQNAEKRCNLGEFQKAYLNEREQIGFLPDGQMKTI
jgi:hypothetical protein